MNKPITFSMQGSGTDPSNNYTSSSFFNTLLNNIKTGFQSLNINVSTDSSFDPSKVNKMTPSEISQYSTSLVDLYGMTNETMTSVKDDIEPLQLTGNERQIAELPYEKKLKMRMEQQFKDKLERDPLLKNFYDGLGQEISSVSALVPQNNQTPNVASNNIKNLLNGGSGEFGEGKIRNIADLQSESVTGGLNNDVTGNVEFGNTNGNLIDVINSTATSDNHFGNPNNLLNDEYKHDTSGNPYINSHRIQIEDFDYNLAGQVSGVVDQQDQVDEERAIQDIKRFLAASDNPQRDLKLAIARFGSPGQLNTLLRFLDPKITPTKQEMERLGKIGIGANGLSLDHQH